MNLCLRSGGRKDRSLLSLSCAQVLFLYLDVDCVLACGTACTLTTALLCIGFSLQVLLSAAGDLLSTLVESEDTALLGAYIGSVMPSDGEWEKMRQALPVQVCPAPQCTSHSGFLVHSAFSLLNLE